LAFHRENKSSAATCFVVRDHNGQQLAYVYYESEPGRRSAAKLLTKDEARRCGTPAFGAEIAAGKGRNVIPRVRR
jgi:hypothetical protein